MKRERCVVAIDGPSGAGKSTISKGVAAQLGFIYLDTGAMYRCVGLLLLRRGVDPLDEQALGEVLADLAIEFRTDAGADQRTICNGEDVTRAIREHAVSEAASRASSVPLVREKLVAMQRRMGAAGGVVMEGRDIGTNVFPDAEVKVFLTAGAEVRAERRVKQLLQSGQQADYETILADQLRRDRRDSERAVNPLIQAPDAVLLDSSALTIFQVIERIVALVRRSC